MVEGRWDRLRIRDGEMWERGVGGVVDADRDRDKVCWMGWDGMGWRRRCREGMDWSLWMVLLGGRVAAAAAAAAAGGGGLFGVGMDVVRSSGSTSPRIRARGWGRGDSGGEAATHCQSS